MTRKKGEGLFPGKTLYQMVAAIQKHLNVNKIQWKLVDDCEDLKTVLDNVMQERAKLNIGMVPKQAELISYEFEEKMWGKGILGEDKPETLRNTVLFLLGLNCCLRAVEEHYYLRRDMPDMMSQLQIDYDENGVKSLVYREDCVTKTHDGGLNDMHNERKVVWVYPNESNINRCPVRLVQKYLSLCPPYFKKDNFYLKSKQKQTPTQWYSEQVVGQTTLGKEQEKRCETVSVSPSTTEEVKVKKKDVESVENSVNVDKTGAVREQINETNVAQILSELLKASKTEGKRTIKIQIEIISE